MDAYWTCWFGEYSAWRQIAFLATPPESACEEEKASERKLASLILVASDVILFFPRSGSDEDRVRSVDDTSWSGIPLALQDFKGEWISPTCYSTPVIWLSQSGKHWHQVTSETINKDHWWMENIHWRDRLSDGHVQLETW